MATSLQQRFADLPAAASRILLVSGLPTQLSNDQRMKDDFYRLFGQFGKLVDVRVSSHAQTVGHAFVVFEDILDATRCHSQISVNYAFHGQPIKVDYFVDPTPT